MKLETRISLYFVIMTILILGGLSVLLYHTGLPFKYGIPIKIGGIILFWLGTLIFKKHFSLNE
jgi:hypothetical protein